MSDNWTTDPTVLPDEFEQMQQVAELPIPPEWFAQQGVPMREAEIEPGWPLLHGIVRTPDGPFMVVGAPGDDGVGLWAKEDMAPGDAVDAFQAAMGHTQAPLSVTPKMEDDGDSN